MKLPTTSLALLPLLVSSAAAISKITVAGHMSITDDEWGNDEHATRDHEFLPYTIGEPASNHATLAWTEGMGGEVRIEVTCTMTYLLASDAVRFNCNAKLYEGTSESSNDLDGQVNVVKTVGRNRNEDIEIKVRNTDEGGDHAEIRLHVTNRKL